jgi:cytoskeletal protein CcmA (bactofilin family)
VSSTPDQMPEPESRKVATMGSAVRVVGKIFTKEDLYIDCDVEGAIESKDNKITIGPGGRVRADIRACEVIILGQVQGNIEASDKVDLRKDSNLVGDVTAPRISLEDGAFFKGRIDTEMPDAKRRSAAAPADPSRPRH